jgi:hypothetical protein
MVRSKSAPTLRMRREILEEWHPKDACGSRLAGTEGVEELTPERLEHLGVEDDARLDRVRAICPQVLTHLGQRKALGRRFGKDPEAHQGPQNAPQARRVHASRRGEVGCRPRAVLH